MLETLLWSTILVIAGGIASHSALWYRIGKLEKAVYNGNCSNNNKKEAK